MSRRIDLRCAEFRRDETVKRGWNIGEAVTAIYPLQLIRAEGGGFKRGLVVGCPGAGQMLLP